MEEKKDMAVMEEDMQVKEEKVDRGLIAQTEGASEPQ